MSLKHVVANCSSLLAHVNYTTSLNNTCQLTSYFNNRAQMQHSRNSAKNSGQQLIVLAKAKKKANLKFVDLSQPMFIISRYVYGRGLAQVI